MNKNPFKELVDKSFISSLEKTIDFVRRKKRSDKIKSVIIKTIREKNKITAKELSDILHLSRNRCSEYLKSLEREGRLIGIIINRKKYYKLRV